MRRLVVLPKNYIGYWGAVVMNYYEFSPNLSDDDVIIYADNFKQVLEMEDVTDFWEVWFVGVPYYDSYNWVLLQLLKKDIPVWHFASFGDEMFRYDNIRESQVLEEASPLMALVNALEDYKEDKRQFFPDGRGMDRLEEILENIEYYHRYNPIYVTGTPWSLILLADHYREGLVHKYNEWDSLEINLQENEALLERLRENANEYILKKVESCRVKEVSYADKRLFVFMLYAEDHVNEISHKLLNSVAEYGVPAAVLVGKHTRGGDLFSIRTSEGVSAADIADILSGKRSGKDRVGTVFLPATLDVTSQAVASTLETGFRENRL